METLNNVRERLTTYGIHSLNERELLMLLKMPTDKTFDEQLNEGNEKAKAVFALANRYINDADYREKKTLTSSQKTKELMDSYFYGNNDTERFYVVFLNRANKVLGVHCLSQGGQTGTVVDIRVLMRKALENKATGIILSHNHPSETPQPSAEDKTITRQIKEAANLLQINLLDHIIWAGIRYYSFADEGIL